jgi:hypothetical protein
MHSAVCRRDNGWLLELGGARVPVSPGRVAACGPRCAPVPQAPWGAARGR